MGAICFPSGLKPRIAGFSLVEVLVAMGIVSLLIGLTLPAIQSARLAVTKLQCLHNLRQMGLALHGYHGNHGKFPPGHISQQRGKAFSFMGWQPPLLPFLEKETLWAQTLEDFSRVSPKYSFLDHRGFGTIVRDFVCPSDFRLFYLEYSLEGTRPALTSYAGVMGTSVKQMNGMLFSDSETRILDATDGSSCTLLVAERPPALIAGLAGGTPVMASLMGRQKWY